MPTVIASSVQPIYGLPLALALPDTLLQVQGIGNWSSSLVATLTAAPTGYLLAGCSHDTGTITGVACNGYTFRKLLEVTSLCMLWLGKPTGAASGTAVTFSGTAGGYLNPVVAEFTGTMRNPVVFGAATNITGAATMATPPIIPVAADLTAIAIAACQSGAGAWDVGSGTGWTDISGATTRVLFAMAYRKVSMGVPVSASFHRSSGGGWAAGIVLLGSAKRLIAPR